jgi:hypothetical protein
VITQISAATLKKFRFTFLSIFETERIAQG